MRIIFALAIWAIVLSGLFLYMEARSNRSSTDSAPATGKLETAGPYALEITILTTLQPDPFALTTGSGNQAESIHVRVNGRSVLSRTERIEAGTALRIEPVPGLLSGVNEIYLGASPPLDEHGRPAAIRLRLFNGLVPVVDETLWSDGGSKISGTISFSLPGIEGLRDMP